MKVVLLAGGYGSRLSEETNSIPKPMVDIGGRPMLWHIMKIYSKYGFNDFVILLGYKGYVIKEYFSNYFLHQSDVTIDMRENKIDILNNSSEPWKVTLIDTGLNTMTGGRIKRAESFIGDDRFMLTYGDGLADINVNDLLSFHNSHGKIMTMTSCQQEGRFGALEIGNDNQVTNFIEKPKGDGFRVNAGFFVCEPQIFNYIAEGDETIFEKEPLMNLAKNGCIKSYQHDKFWMPMDTLRDKLKLNNLWNEGRAPWRIWDDDV